MPVGETDGDNSADAAAKSARPATRRAPQRSAEAGFVAPPHKVEAATPAATAAGRGAGVSYSPPLASLSVFSPLRSQNWVRADTRAPRPPRLYDVQFLFGRAAAGPARPSWISLNLKCGKL